ncbi:alkylation response protein AidB-like acyl-CoA dehydrogenase [Streptosporangium becharense]|uniref:Acyl-CoA dehydrogenase n=1 Tax=Streptosporangium becharense TaxID=1816182 RepID=A0A7W9IN82_9ACTN|nr:acyl-CoA dehydrogenase family protein [Streptosporangium becharense]MBB2910391.1 alkylation response protein AidB-like acyl-CoA dehydrogenase [Streptosporangium becharense]MBB5823134.1 acyl-CoA dehydrogenase [Streptosporangium becharense]
MDFTIPERTGRFRSELAELFGKRSVRDLLARVAAREDGMDGDVREVFRVLGAAGALAPAWPAEYGGRGGDFTETIALLEELVRYRIPSSLYYISVQIIGSLILQSGTHEQKKTILPRLASGELSACILFTEPDNGSDLAGITTRARREGSEWVIDGHKKYNLKTAYADLALCAARIDDAASRYEGITLFLLPMSTPGITVKPIPSMADEQFHDVRLDGVRVTDDAVFGDPGAGWSLITRLFSAERSGLDYYARGLNWMRLSAESLACDGAAGDAEAAGLARRWARLDASRLLASRVMQRLQDDEPDIIQASLSKWHCSESAQRVAWWALETLGLPMVTTFPADADRALEAAYREAAGLTISGGASEVLLEVVAGARLLGDVPDDRERSR